MEGKRRGFIFLLLAVVLLFSWPVEGQALKETDRIVLQISNPYMTVRGVKKEVDPGRGTVPVIVDNRTLLPIRALIESLEGEVQWDERQKKVTVRLGANTAELWIGRQKTFVNGKEKTMDVAPRIINGRTMVPLRYVIESVGLDVQWEASTKSVYINLQGHQGNGMQQIKSYLGEADSLKYLIRGSIDADSFDSEKGWVKVIGEYGDFNAAYRLLLQYFDAGMAVKEFEKGGLEKVGSDVYWMVDQGGMEFVVTPDSFFSLVVNGDAKKVVDVQIASELEGAILTRRYTVELAKMNRWIITNVQDISLEEELWYNAATVLASSELGKEYKAGYIGDYDAQTAWVENAKGPGIGEWVRLGDDSCCEINVSGVKMINGYAKNEGTYGANHRVKKIKIEFSNGESMVRELEDHRMDFQKIHFGRNIKTDYIKITILEVYPGSKYQDTCISEIRPFHITYYSVK